MELSDYSSAGAVLISAVGAWFFAHRAIKNSAEISKKKSTFDYLSKLSWDKDYIDAKNTFLKIKAGKKKLRAVAEEYEATKTSDQTDENSEELREIISQHSAIKNILNEYEAMAIAIKSDALDEAMMKANIRQQFVSHIEACSEFIDYTRSKSGTKDPTKIWCEVQELKRSWE